MCDRLTKYGAANLFCLVADPDCFTVRIALFSIRSIAANLSAACCTGGMPGLFAYRKMFEI